MFHFCEENVVIKGLRSRYCRIYFGDGEIFSLLSFQNVCTIITLQTSLKLNACVRRLNEKKRSFFKEKVST